MLEQQLFNALSLGCVYALFALGFTLIFGVLGVINLSQGAIFMVGAYAALAAITRLHAPLWFAADLRVRASRGWSASRSTAWCSSRCASATRRT